MKGDISMERTATIGMPIYCIIDGDIKKRKITRFSTDGQDLIVITDSFDDCVYMRDAFPTKEEAIKEMKTRLRDC